MVKTRIGLLVWLLPVLAWGQEVLLPLQARRPVATAAKSNTQAVGLPFFDDFSSAGGSLQTALWQSQGATADNGDRLLPPTIGVATLDAIASDGNLYPLASTSLFPADTLTSCPVRIDTLAPADSLVLSFYYLPGGGHGNLWERTGETPDDQDSLFLEFYRAADSAWVTVWCRGGISVDTLMAQTGLAWQYVAVALDDASWFDSAFRFRFRNFCSLETAAKPGLKGNCDMWHVDYVYLDRGRSSVAPPEFRDVAFVAPAPSMLQHYSAMPARQYRAGDMAANLALTIGNLYSSNLATHYGYAVVGPAGDTLYRYDGGYENAPPYQPSGSYQDIPAHAAPAVGYTFPESPLPATYTIVHTVREGNAQDVRPQNDTVRYRQEFADYYAYDDGTAENGYGLTSTASRVFLAYRFDLNAEDTLTAVDLYFNRTYQGENEQVPFQLTVWSAEEGRPSAVLYRDEVRRYADFCGLNAYCRYRLERPLVVAGSVFVGFEQGNNYYINLGFDRSRNTADRIYYLTGTDWQQSILSGSLMMRPCFGAAAAVGIADAKDRPMRVFPNPVSDRLHIEGVAPGAQVELFDALGRKVAQSAGGETLDVSALAAGVYLLRVAGQGERRPATHKIIITR